jgi:predicted RNase H-like HicB family nuclease
MKLHLSIQIWQKGSWYLAKCPELAFISQGRTRQEAQENLIEVIEIQFEEMSRMGTLDEYLDECGYEVQDDVAAAQMEMVGFEKMNIQVH